LVKQALPEARYLSFDDPLNRDFARQDPYGLLTNPENTQVILDEIQYVPELLPYLKMKIDANRLPGRWILTGSQQFHLLSAVSETLAGRVAILELPPFNFAEIAGEINVNLAKLLWTGLYPQPCLQPASRDVWLRSYLQTYVERDLRQIENIRDNGAFMRFVQLSAAFHAQEFKAAVYARDCGISAPTIQNWARLLEAGYLGIRLPPFHENFGKRLIKSHKFYWIDPGLVNYLTRQPSPEAALHSSLGGALFEGFVIGEAWKTFLALGKTADLYFWRSNDGLEVDLIVTAAGRLWPVEIKLTATPSSRHCQPLLRLREIVGAERMGNGIVVCQVKEKTVLPYGIHALPWQEFSDWLHKLLMG
jgi:predicted AAA+ superfamily ATPase